MLRPVPIHSIAPDFLILDDSPLPPPVRGTPLTSTGYALALALRDELVAGGATTDQFTAQSDTLVDLNDLIDEYEAAQPPRIVGVDVETRVHTETIVTPRFNR